MPEVTPVETGVNVGNKSGGESNNGAVGPTPPGTGTGAKAQIPTSKVIDNTRA